MLYAWAALAQQKPRSEIQKALDEFRVQTRNLGLGPDRARNGGRSSAARSAWHGRLFENFRDDFLDAVPHEISQRGENRSLLRRNQFGFPKNASAWYGPFISQSRPPPRGHRLPNPGATPTAGGQFYAGRCLFRQASEQK